MLSSDTSRSKAGTVTVKQTSTDGIVEKKIKTGVNKKAFQAEKTPLKPSRPSDTADIETQESSYVENNSLTARPPEMATNNMSSDANVVQPDPDVGQILNEIAALRAEQDLKHTELKNKLESNLMKDQAAFTKLEESLSNLKNEISGTKTDLFKRISTVEENTVKINPIEGLKKLVSSMENQPAILTSSEGPLNKKISFLINKVEQLEKENKKTKITIAGLTLSFNNHSQEVKHFLTSNFNIDCSNIIVKKLRSYILVDLLDPSLKSTIFKAKKNKLTGTKIFINPDRTNKEQYIDWQCRQFCKQNYSEGKKVARKDNKQKLNQRYYPNGLRERSVEKLDNSSAELVKITFWNLHGYSNLELSSLREYSDIIAACETWTTLPLNLRFLEKYHNFWSDAVREHAVGRASDGLVTAINNRYNATILAKSPSWIFNKVEIGNTIIILGSVYFRKCLVLHSLLSSLQVLIDSIKATHTHDLFIIGGDMNARVGLLNPWPPEMFLGLHIHSARTSLDSAECDRGHQLLDFMLDNDFVLLNGRTNSDSPAQPTYDFHGTLIIDLVWANTSSLHYILDLEVILEPSLSDHRPVCVSIQVSSNSKPESCCTTPTCNTTKIKWDEKLENEFQSQLYSTRFPSNQSEAQPDDQYNWLQQSIFNAAENTGMVQRFNTAENTLSVRKSGKSPGPDQRTL
ncbi:Protein of unknown function [Cotesia congregata]|uniref:Endonuclease/exonuclease/phosphatase domain-containing protein n=1 Tax=Cotesia congregata TaxID=51543 RepID=A0A8J2MNE2_COTCN|nr:Protein of unknown function [Cotesia congregata]